MATRSIDSIRSGDSSAAAVIDESLKLRASHSAAPARAVLDLVLKGRCGRPIEFGEISPISPFGLLVIEAFDAGMPASFWVGLYGGSDPRVITTLEGIWHAEVWPAFTGHYGIG